MGLTISTASIRIKSKNKIYACANACVNTRANTCANTHGVIDNLSDIKPNPKKNTRSITPESDDTITISNIKNELNISNNGIKGTIQSLRLLNKLNSFDLTTILFMDISHNSITDIAYFPPNLINLNCSFNFITDLSISQLSIEIIDCSNNSIGTIDLTLCINLHTLNCSNNNIESLDQLPAHLQQIDCSKNAIKYLDYLPRALKILYCQNNLLESMDNMPPALKKINLSNNFMRKLSLISATINHINCSFNSIEIIGNNNLKLYNLRTFYCAHNKITHIDFDQFPNLETVDCSHNQLTMLVKISLSVKNLKCDGNDIKTITDVRGKYPVVYQMICDNSE